MTTLRGGHYDEPHNQVMTRAEELSPVPQATALISERNQVEDDLFLVTASARSQAGSSGVERTCSGWEMGTLCSSWLLGSIRSRLLDDPNTPNDPAMPLALYFSPQDKLAVLLDNRRTLVEETVPLQTSHRDSDGQRGNGKAGRVTFGERMLHGGVCVKIMLHFDSERPQVCKVMIENLVDDLRVYLPIWCTSRLRKRMMRGRFSARAGSVITPHVHDLLDGVKVSITHAVPNLPVRSAATRRCRHRYPAGLGPRHANREDRWRSPCEWQPRIQSHVRLFAQFRVDSSSPPQSEQSEGGWAGS